MKGRKRKRLKSSGKYFYYIFICLYSPHFSCWAKTRINLKFLISLFKFMTSAVTFHSLGSNKKWRIQAAKCRRANNIYNKIGFHIFTPFAFPLSFFLPLVSFFFSFDGNEKNRSFILQLLKSVKKNCFCIKVLVEKKSWFFPFFIGLFIWKVAIFYSDNATCVLSYEQVISNLTLWLSFFFFLAPL